ncbi:MAG: 2-dehydro-3-deoxygalactonokinase [Bacteroidota bacterium]
MEKQMSNYFLSCDWGTSSFRLKLVNRKERKVVATIEHSQGIKATFLSWKNAQSKDRIAFYQAVLREAIQQLSQQVTINVSQLPIILSGMASSSIGMKELPYADCPVFLNIKHLVVEHIAVNQELSHEIYLISGVQKEDDVMRGEEIQAIGWAKDKELNDRDYTLILPGTHSKHLHLHGGQLIDFKTYMTGELFEIITCHSILQNSIDQSVTWSSEAQTAFTRGVLDSKIGNLSNLLFTIRAKDLQGKWSRGASNFYLSGLLIGNELKDLSVERIVLFGDSKFEKLYKAVLETLGHQSYEVIPPQEVENLVVWGQMAVLSAVQEMRNK